MNKAASEAEEFAEAIRNKIPSNDRVDLVIGLPALFLQELMTPAEGIELRISARNCYWENSGAFTGETPPAALADLGVHYVIIGHLGRREYFHETDEDTNKKAEAIFASGMTPVLCHDESLETYEAGKTAEQTGGQIIASLADSSAEQVSDTAIAYEPIQAIDTGKSVDVQVAGEICGVVHQTIEKLYEKEVLEAARIQYDDSVKPESVAEYTTKENVDGTLVGSASLQADSSLPLLGAVK